MLHDDLLLIDVETTGLSARNDSIVQLSACLLSRKDLSELAYFSTRVRPSTPMSSQAHAVHGLSNEDLADAPTIHDAIAEFSKFAPARALLCGHNVSFDVGFLKCAYEATGLEYPFDYHSVDIWSVAFFVLGSRGVEMKSYNLNALCGLFGIPRSRHHDALEDVRASAAVLRYLYVAAQDAEIEFSGQLTFDHL